MRRNPYACRSCDQLRADLAAARETIERYETNAARPDFVDAVAELGGFAHQDETAGEMVLRVVRGLRADLAAARDDIASLEIWLRDMEKERDAARADLAAEKQRADSAEGELAAWVEQSKTDNAHRRSSIAAWTQVHGTLMSAGIDVTSAVEGVEILAKRAANEKQRADAAEAGLADVHPVLGAMKRERDAATARAEKAERELAEMREVRAGVVTPIVDATVAEAVRAERAAGAHACDVVAATADHWGPGARECAYRIRARGAS